MKKQITVGVLGCGYWGPLLVRNFKGLPDCQLQAVCDVDVARVKHVCGLYPDVEGMTTPQQFITERGLDAVVLAACGLDRLGLADEIGHRFEPEALLPEAGQGALGPPPRGPLSRRSS